LITWLCSKYCNQINSCKKKKTLCQNNPEKLNWLFYFENNLMFAQNNVSTSYSKDDKRINLATPFLGDQTSLNRRHKK
jgi:hypothetical protein